MNITPKKLSIKNSALFILLGCVLLIYFFADPSSTAFFPACPLYKYTGIYCPGCGSQRATHAMLHLNFKELFQQNVLFLFGFIALLYHITIVFFNSFFNKNYKNYLYQKNTLLLILFIILVFWVLRNIPFYPFNLLAPH